jgi:hypothetical protein
MGRCKREGCPSFATGGPFCSWMCSHLDRKIEQALSLARNLGPTNPISYELQRASVAAGDGLSELTVWTRAAKEALK